MKKIIVSIVFISVSFAYCGGSLFLPEKSKEILAKSPQIALLATGGFRIVDDNLNKPTEQLEEQDLAYAMDDRLNGPESWSYDRHARDRMKEREISKKEIKITKNKGEKFPVENDRIIYIRKVHGRVIKVVVENNEIVTVIPYESLSKAISSAKKQSKAALMKSRYAKIDVNESNHSSSFNLTKAEESERERVLTIFKANLPKVNKTDNKSAISAVNPKTGTIKIIFPNKQKFVLQVSRIPKDHATRFPTRFTYDPEKLLASNRTGKNYEKKYEAVDFVMQKFGELSVLKNDKGEEFFRLVLPVRKILADSDQSIAGTSIYEYIKVPSNNNNIAGEELILLKRYFEKN